MNLYRAMMMISFFQDAILLFVKKNQFRISPKRNSGCLLGSRTWQTCFKEVVPAKMIVTNLGPLPNGLAVSSIEEIHLNEERTEPNFVSDNSFDSSSSCEIIFRDTDCSNYEDDSEENSEDDSDEDDNDSCSCSSQASDETNTRSKKVTFDLKPVVHRMFMWDYAYRAARISQWQEVVADRNRFKQRILDCRLILDPILQVDHRLRIRTERFS
ncbi:hypothetical protein M0802_008891 [Mischocyttarus mexicanus]|nr:hypothetical protein M0802_008891 [Mischocyttarus mexicanus]